MGKDPVSTCRDLSTDLDLACDWALRWGTLFSAEKKVNICLSRQGKHPLCPLGCPWVERVPEVMSHKHLGVHFNNRLTWVTHSDEVYKSCARKVRIIPHLLTKLKPASIHRIYVGVVPPKIEYRGTLSHSLEGPRCCSRSHKTDSF